MLRSKFSHYKKNMPILSISYQIKSLLNMEMDGAIILYCPI